MRSLTWHPEAGMTQRQIDKEVQRQAVLFEEQIRRECANDIEHQRIHFQSLADEWLTLMEQTKELKPSSLSRMKSCRERTYRAIGQKNIDEISFRCIQQFIVALSKDGVNQQTGRGLSEKSQRHYITFISDVMRYAKRCGLISANPCAGISVVKTASKERTPYTVEEEIALLQAMQEYDAPLKYQLIIQFMVYCGMRRGEVLGLEWKDIDLETGLCNIQRTSLYQNAETGTYTSTPKTKSSCRRIRLPQVLLSALRNYKLAQNAERVQLGDFRKDSDRLFTKTDGTPMNPERPYHWLCEFCQKANLPFKGLHSFRHAFATGLLSSQKVDIKTISSILGHAHTSTTLNIYAHSIQEVQSRAMDVVPDLIQQKAEELTTA